MTDTPTDTGAALIERLDGGADRRSERREFFRTALGAGAVAAVGAAAISIGSAVSAATATTETDLFNFLLNLKYLEAQFYSYAVSGTGLSSTLLTAGSDVTATTPGTVTPGHIVTFTDPLVSQYAHEIAAEKLAQVTYLRNTILTTLAVAQPAIDLGSTATSAFSVAMQAAKVVASGTAFDPFGSDQNFLLAAFFLEDIGVTACKALVSSLTTKTYIDAMAGLVGAGAYHAALIRTVLYTKGTTTANYRTFADGISAARNLLDGTVDDDQGISPVTIANSQSAALNGLQASNIVPASVEGLTYGRATTAVLNVLYLNSLAVSKGGFFPSGTNGTYATSAPN